MQAWAAATSTSNYDKEGPASSLPALLHRTDAIFGTSDRDSCGCPISVTVSLTAIRFPSIRENPMITAGECRAYSTECKRLGSDPTILARRAAVLASMSRTSVKVGQPLLLTAPKPLIKAAAGPTGNGCGRVRPCGPELGSRCRPPALSSCAGQARFHPDRRAHALRRRRCPDLRAAPHHK